MRDRRRRRPRDPRYFRPTEVETLLGDPGKAKQKLGWAPTTTLAELARKMVDSDYVAAKRDSLVKRAGYQAFDYHECPVLDRDAGYSCAMTIAEATLTAITHRPVSNCQPAHMDDQPLDLSPAPRSPSHDFA